MSERNENRIANVDKNNMVQSVQRGILQKILGKNIKRIALKAQTLLGLHTIDIDDNVIICVHVKVLPTILKMKLNI